MDEGDNDDVGWEVTIEGNSIIDKTGCRFNAASFLSIEEDEEDDDHDEEDDKAVVFVVDDDSSHTKQLSFSSILFKYFSIASSFQPDFDNSNKDWEYGNPERFIKSWTVSSKNENNDSSSKKFDGGRGS